MTNMTAEPSSSWNTISLLRDVILYGAVALGVPGNILSAIVWLRLHVAINNHQPSTSQR